LIRSCPTGLIRAKNKILSHVVAQKMAFHAEEGNYAIKRKVTHLGDILAVTIPKWLAEAKGIRRGDTVLLRFGEFRGILVEKPENAEETD